MDISTDYYRDTKRIHTLSADRDTRRVRSGTQAQHYTPAGIGSGASGTRHPPKRARLYGLYLFDESKPLPMNNERGATWTDT